MPTTLSVAMTGLAVLGLLSNLPSAQAQTPTQHDSSLKVILLGTRGGPAIEAQRPGNGTLVIAGREMLLFDCGRDASAAITRMAILPADVTKVFLTHLHSDHVVGLPDLWLSGWIISRRTVPWELFGPAGTAAMAAHLTQAFAFDLEIRTKEGRQDPAGGRLAARDVEPGVYEMYCLPLPVVGADGAPARVVLRQY